MKQKAWSEYPLLRARFADLERVVLEPFVKHDSAAAKIQKRHRRLQLILIIGVTLTALFGALQSAFDGARWIGAALAILALSASAVANRQRRTKPLTRYLIERAKAEELRSLFFTYLSGLGGLTSRQLETAVAAIDNRTIADGSSKQ